VRIVTWNCNGAFRKKFEKASELDADIYVIQECENPLLSADQKYKEWAKNFHWVGDNRHRGLGIFARSSLLLMKLDWNCQFGDRSLKYFLPCSVNNQFNILAVWTQQDPFDGFSYIGQFWKYLQINREKLSHSIIAGDLNSNSRWDINGRSWNHSNVVFDLHKMGIYSLYHKESNEAQGLETVPTFYLQRKLAKPYHIDYCFASIKIADALKSIRIGSVENWLKYSDHLPIFCEFETF
jgi:exonuclease III